MIDYDSLFGTSTGVAPILGFNAATGLSEALIEAGESDRALMEAMLKVKGAELNMRSESFVNEAAISSLHENAGARIIERIKALMKKLAATIVSWAKAFGKAVKKFFSKDNQIAAAVRKFVDNKKLLHALSDKEVEWYKWRRMPVTHPDEKITDPDAITSADLIKLSGKDDAEIYDKLFGIKLNGQIASDAIHDAVFMHFAGAKTLDEIKSKEKLGHIPEASDGFIKLLNQAEQASTTYEKKMTELGKRIDAAANQLDKMKAANTGVENNDGNKLNEGMAKVLGCYRGGLIIIQNCYKHLFMTNLQNVRSLAASFANLAQNYRDGKSKNEMAVDFDMADVVYEAYCHNFDEVLAETYITEEDGGEPDSDKDKDKKDDSDSFGSKTKGVARGVWAKIVAIFQKIASVVESVITKIKSLIINDKKLIEKHKDELTKPENADKIKSIKVAAYIPGGTDGDFNAAVEDDTAVPEGKSVDEYKKLMSTYSNLRAVESYIGEIGISDLIDDFTANEKVLKGLKDDYKKAKENLAKARRGGSDDEAKKKMAYAQACQVLAKAKIKAAGKTHASMKAALLRAISACKGADKAKTEAVIEAATEEVDNVIANAVNSADAQGIEDVNLADTDLLDSDISTDPNALDYDKTDCYSATTDMSDVKVAGTVDADRKTDTIMRVALGNQVKAVAAEMTQMDSALDSWFGF